MKFGILTGKRQERCDVASGVSPDVAGVHPAARIAVGDGSSAGRMPAARLVTRVTRTSAFTLAEVLAALMFMAIVVPVAVEAFNLASQAGEIGRRKSEAIRVADRVLNESVVTTNWNTSLLSGTAIEGTHEFRWTLKNQYWPGDSNMRLLTAEVDYSVAGRRQTVRLDTLASLPAIGGGVSGF